MLALEARGVPTALIVVGWLVSIAEETKNVGGLAGLNVVPLERSLFGLKRTAIGEAAENAASLASTALTRL